MNKKHVYMIGAVAILTPLAIKLIRRAFHSRFCSSFISIQSFKDSIKAAVALNSNVPNSVLVSLNIEESDTISELYHNQELNQIKIMMLENLELKISSQTHKENPFLPPFQQGIFIMDLNDTHRLIFNKFIVSKSHVLVITKEYEIQSSPLSTNDLIYSYLVASALKGFAFFNSDRRAGASMPHKHLQVIPYENFSTFYLSKILEIIAHPFQYIYEENKLLGVSYLKFPFFDQYKHILIKFRQLDEQKDTLEKYGKYLQYVYENGRAKIGCQNVNHSFNMVMGANWMLIILRKSERAYGQISVNALGSLGSMLVSKREKYELLKSQRPSDIFSQIYVNTGDSEKYLIE